MASRFVSIYFPYLVTDWFSLRQPELKRAPLVLRTPSHGRMIITALNAEAEKNGLCIGMTVADARAMIPNLIALDDKPELATQLLHKLAEWCIRFTPCVAVDLPDGIILDASGCSHLWKGDQLYLDAIQQKLNGRGYEVRIAMADTIGVAWAHARYGRNNSVILSDHQKSSLSFLPPEALRFEQETIEKLHKLGLHRIGQFIDMPPSSLRRRFGQHILLRINQAIGQEMELMQRITLQKPFQEWLPCLESISTATGIEIAITQLLEKLCLQLLKQQKGLRKAVLKGYRIDGKVEQIEVSTSRPTHHVSHVFGLFKLKVQNIDPGFGIELFTLEAPVTEEHLSSQEKMWQQGGGIGDERLSELIDRLYSKSFVKNIQCHLPEEHHWPERSFRIATSFKEKPTTHWLMNKLRPLQLLPVPETIEVTAPIPDYPPMLFRHRGKIHKIIKADGPERIEQEWWIQGGQHRDYYRVEDENGNRYWLFRLGHYDDETYQWYLHGYFP